MASAVFDASAVLALLFDEAGVDVARSHLNGGAIRCVNLAEVLAKLTDKGLPPAEAAEAVGFLGLDVMPMTEDHARQSAAMSASGFLLLVVKPLLQKNFRPVQSPDAPVICERCGPV